MTAICTNVEVFDFVGAPSDVATNHGSMITDLIDRVTSEIESKIGRKITDTTFTDVFFNNGLNCEVIGQSIWLKGVFRDLYSISSITEDGEALTAVADYNDDGDYYIDQRLGRLVRVDSDWSNEVYGIKVTCNVGIGVSATGELYGANVRGDIKQAVIETVAAKSGLWKENVETEGGTIETIRKTPSRQTLANIKKYCLKDA